MQCLIIDQPLIKWNFKPLLTSPTHLRRNKMQLTWKMPARDYWASLIIHDYARKHFLQYTQRFITCWEYWNGKKYFASEVTEVEFLPFFTFCQLFVYLWQLFVYFLSCLFTYGSCLFNFYCLSAVCLLLTAVCLLLPALEATKFFV